MMKRSGGHARNYDRPLEATVAGSNDRPSAVTWAATACSKLWATVSPEERNSRSPVAHPSAKEEPTTQRITATEERLFPDRSERFGAALEAANPRRAPPAYQTSTPVSRKHYQAMTHTVRARAPNGAVHSAIAN
jgi:hypothetical protein